VRLDDELLRLVDVIRPNSAEAQVLTDIEVKDRDTARHAAQALLARGVGAVAVQAGPDGNLLVWNDGEHWLSKVNVHGVDATGAGDAFAATLAVLMAEGADFKEAGEFANAAAALATTVVGAQDGLPSREKILRLLGHS
jgi:ribokinase